MARSRKLSRSTKIKIAIMIVILAMVTMGAMLYGKMAASPRSSSVGFYP